MQATVTNAILDSIHDAGFSVGAAPFVRSSGEMLFHASAIAPNGERFVCTAPTAYEAAFGLSELVGVEWD